MANYVAFVRSNYFRVKDLEVFKLFMAGLSGGEGAIFINEKPEDKSLLMFHSSGVPSDPENEECDFFIELREHLKDKEVAVVMEIGYEKMRYLQGYTWAVTPGKDVMHLCLDDIYDKVEKEWGLIPTQAAY